MEDSKDVHHIRSLFLIPPCPGANRRCSPDKRPLLTIQQDSQASTSKPVADEGAHLLDELPAPHLGGVERDGDADLGGGHHVHRDLQLLEDLEQLGQEAVLAQHARAHNVQHRHVALAHDARQQRLAHVALPRDQGARGRRVVRVLHADRDVGLARGPHGLRVEHLAERGGARD